MDTTVSVQENCPHDMARVSLTSSLSDDDDDDDDDNDDDDEAEEVEVEVAEEDEAEEEEVAEDDEENEEDEEDEEDDPGILLHLNPFSTPPSIVTFLHSPPSSSPSRGMSAGGSR
jgi:hypothetical protein